MELSEGSVLNGTSTLNSTSMVVSPSKLTPAPALRIDASHLESMLNFIRKRLLEHEQQIALLTPDKLISIDSRLRRLEDQPISSNSNSTSDENFHPLLEISVKQLENKVSLQKIESETEHERMNKALNKLKQLEDALENRHTLSENFEEIVMAKINHVMTDIASSLGLTQEQMDLKMQRKLGVTVNDLEKQVRTLDDALRLRCSSLESDIGKYVLMAKEAEINAEKGQAACRKRCQLLQLRIEDQNKETAELKDEVSELRKMIKENTKSDELWVEKLQKQDALAAEKEEALGEEMAQVLQRLNACEKLLQQQADALEQNVGKGIDNHEWKGELESTADRIRQALEEQLATLRAEMNDKYGECDSVLSNHRGRLGAVEVSVESLDPKVERTIEHLKDLFEKLRAVKEQSDDVVRRLGVRCTDVDTKLAEAEEDRKVLRALMNSSVEDLESKIPDAAELAEKHAALVLHLGAMQGGIAAVRLALQQSDARVGGLQEQQRVDRDSAHEFSVQAVEDLRCLLTSTIESNLEQQRADIRGVRDENGELHQLHHAQLRRIQQLNARLARLQRDFEGMVKVLLDPTSVMAMRKKLSAHAATLAEGYQQYEEQVQSSGKSHNHLAKVQRLLAEKSQQVARLIACLADYSFIAHCMNDKGGYYMVDPPEVERRREMEAFVNKGVFGPHSDFNGGRSEEEEEEDEQEAEQGASNSSGEERAGGRAVERDSNANNNNSNTSNMRKSRSQSQSVTNSEARRTFEARLRRALEIALSKYTAVRDDGTLFSKKQLLPSCAACNRPLAPGGMEPGPEWEKAGEDTTPMHSTMTSNVNSNVNSSSMKMSNSRSLDMSGSSEAGGRDYVRIGGFKMPRRLYSEQHQQHSLHRVHSSAEVHEGLTGGGGGGGARASVGMRMTSSVSAADAAFDKSQRSAGRFTQPVRNTNRNTGQRQQKQRPFSAAPSVGRIRPQHQHQPRFGERHNLGGLLRTGAAPIDDV